MQEFPDQAQSVIEMVIDACKYDLNKSRSLLESMATTQRAKSLTKSSGRSPAASPARLDQSHNMLFKYI